MFGKILENRKIDIPNYKTKKEAFAELQKGEVVVSDNHLYYIIEQKEYFSRYRPLGFIIVKET